MKYIECDVYCKKESGYWGVVDNPKKVLVFTPDTKDEEIEKLPEEQKQIAYVAHRMGMSDKICAFKFGNHACMGTGLYVWNYHRKEFYDVVGTRNPIALCE